MPIDIKIFEDMTDSSVYFIDPIDISSLKVLYENSKRMGHDNVNVKNASLDLGIWFPDLVEKIIGYIKLISKGPTFMLYRIENDNTTVRVYAVRNERFETDTDLIAHFSEISKFQNIALFSITKYADLTTLSTYFIVRFTEILLKDEIRDMKLDFLTKKLDDKDSERSEKY